LKPVDKLPILSEAVKGILIRGRVYSAIVDLKGTEKSIDAAYESPEIKYSAYL
jgi:hypothetical protein